MSIQPRFQSADGDLVGCTQWTAPLEGAYTRVAKIAIINALAPAALCELLFGRRLAPASYSPVHGRSFLTDAWASQRAAGATGKSVAAGFLSHQCGSWASAIAADDRLRFCRACADVGYQSAIHQIDALTSCPLHGAPLLDECSHCGTPTPRYALTREAFRTPMQCTACGRGYGMAWDGSANFDRWTGPERTHALQLIAQRLQAWSARNLDWPTLSDWIDDPSGDAMKARRVHVFHALSAASTAPRTNVTRSRVIVTTAPCEPWRIQEPRDWQRLAIYKSIFRHVVRRHCRYQRRGHFHFADSLRRHQANGAMLPRRSEFPPALHALALWMSRCEVEELSFHYRSGLGRSGPGDSRIRLKPALVRWPGDYVVPDNLWGHFVWRCFLEDLWTAQRWQDAVQSLGDPFERADGADAGSAQDRARFLEQLAVWTPRMSSRMEPFSSGISHFTWGRSENRRRLCLAVIQRFEGE